MSLIETARRDDRAMKPPLTWTHELARGSSGLWPREAMRSVVVFVIGLFAGVVRRAAS